MKIQAFSQGGSHLHSLRSKRRFPHHLARSASAALLSCGLWPAATQAQAPAQNPDTTSATPALATPASSAVSILIVAFDELNAPSPIGTLPPAPAFAPPATGAIVPVPPMAPLMVPPLNPMGWNGAAPDALWRASAQRRKKKDPTDGLFTPTPIPGGLIPEPGADPKPNARPRPSAPQPVPVVQTPFPINEPLAPPGRAQTAAVSLQRALAARGFADVLTITPQSASVTRALSERRFTARVLLELERAMQTLGAPTTGAAPDPDASARAMRAATRIAQAFGYRAVIAIHVGAPRPDDIIADIAAAPPETAPIPPAVIAPPANAPRVFAPRVFAPGTLTAEFPPIPGEVAPPVANAPNANTPVAPTPQTGVLNIPAPVVPQNPVRADWTLVLADGALEQGEPILFAHGNNGETAMLQSGALTAAGVLERSIRGWKTPVPNERATRANNHLIAARALLATGDVAGAQDELNQSVALDSAQTEAFLLLGDALQTTDPQGSANAYRRVGEMSARDGALLTRLAIAYSGGKTPDYVRALDAGQRALDAGVDTVPLRVALASAHFGRAQNFRRNRRITKAEDAEVEARKQIDRALELAPDDPSAVRLLARNMVANRQYDEALQTLDRIAPRFPRDIEIQSQYARALLGRPDSGREEDAFVASSRVWALSGQIDVSVDELDYRRLARGFDSRVRTIGTTAKQLLGGVRDGAVTPTAALLQLTRLKSDMGQADVAINILRAPGGIPDAAVQGRVFASDLMNQALEQYQTYLDGGGQEIYLTRGDGLARQAITRLNDARTIQ